MKSDQAITLLAEQINKLDNLATQEDHEAYEVWHKHTELLLKRILGDNSDETRVFGRRDGMASIFVTGNPAENARRDTKVYFSHVKSNRSLLTGIVEYLKSTAPSDDQAEPISAGTLDALHHAIKAKCSSLYLSKNYPEAVEKGFKVVRDRLRELTKHETGSEAFGKGGLFIKGAAADNVEHDFQEAVKFLTMAIDQFRNEKSHTSDGKIEDPVRAYEYLALSSLAMHLLDNSEVREKTEEPKSQKPNKLSKSSSQTETTVKLDPLQVLALRLYAAMPLHKELIISRTSGGDTVHPMDTVSDSGLLEELNSIDVQEFEVNLDEMYSWGLVTVDYGRYNSKKFKLAKAGYGALKQLPKAKSEKA